jgi:cephalosporin hydroxylase
MPAPRFLGLKCLKNPLDLWVFQEILYERRPDLILETGTAMGGTTIFLATMLDAIGHGRIVTVDWREREGRPPHPRVTYLLGDSRSDEVVEQMRPRAGEKTMVILDSGHSKDHVLRELRTLGPFVSPGQYLIVEDTNLNGHPIRPDYGPGPMEAVQEFLPEHPEFQPDRSREHPTTSNPSGFLLRSD